MTDLWDGVDRLGEAGMRADIDTFRRIDEQLERQRMKPGEVYEDLAESRVDPEEVLAIMEAAGKL